MPPKESLKRKGAPQHSGAQNRNPKRNKVQESRNILAQPAHRVLNEKGELDVGSFVKSREFEIKALEQGITSSKHGLTQRAFQQVPRELRRRTASHNVKKIPKRLRTRAAKEIKEDNTPTGSARKKDLTSKQWIRRETAKKAARIGAKSREQRETLAQSQSNEGKQASDAEADATESEDGDIPVAFKHVHAPQPKKDMLLKAPKPVTKFRKRQEDKTWLPTHMYHAKRAHMTLPAEPLWRFAIPLSPTEKVYRTTHRSATLRGCVAWDMSYMSTILLEGVENSLLGLFRRMGLPEDQISGKRGQKWQQGLRSWSGWLKEVSEQQRWITSALLIWCAEEKAPLMDLDDEAEPKPVRRSVLLRTHPVGFLQLWNELLKVAKEQRPEVMVEDLRFKIGSIDIEGPQAAEAIAGVLHELPRKKLGVQRTSGIDWPTLARTSSASVANGALLNLTLMDPRLRHPPRPVSFDDVTDDKILEMMAHWPGDKNDLPGLLFDRDARYASCTLQSSQKAINRRKGDAPPGQLPATLSSDPRIPALLCATSPSESPTRQSSWTLILPWDWVLPFWYSLMYFPLSTGGNPRFGGLEEKRQLCFEQAIPWFPADMPGTQSGWNWELREQTKRKRQWEKRPKGKRVEWPAVNLGGDQKGELGFGWACDWAYLFGLKKETDDVNRPKDKKHTREATRKDAKDEKAAKQEPLPNGVSQLLSTQLSDPKFSPAERSLLTVSLKLVHRGVPATCARIYRIPASDDKLRAQWMALAEVRSGNLSISKIQYSTNPPPGQEADGQAPEMQYPHVPGGGDLIGFVTTGNFNMGEGRGTGIGCIALARVWTDDYAGLATRAKGLCIVREAGTPVGRLAEWAAV